MTKDYTKRFDYPIGPEMACLHIIGDEVPMWLSAFGFLHKPEITEVVEGLLEGTRPGTLFAGEYKNPAGFHCFFIFECLSVLPGHIVSQGCLFFPFSETAIHLARKTIEMVCARAEQERNQLQPPKET